MPEDPDEYRKLGTIARLLGMDGETVAARRICDLLGQLRDRGCRTVGSE